MPTTDEARVLRVAEAATGQVWARMLDANPDLQTPARSRLEGAA